MSNIVYNTSETRELVGVPRIPNIEFDTPIYKVNLTIVISVLIISLMIASLIVKIFGVKKANEEDKPGKNPNCQEHQRNAQRLENDIKTESKRREELTKITNDLGTEVAILKTQNDNMNASMKDIKEGNHEIANRLDDLLQQLLDWTNSN